MEMKSTLHYGVFLVLFLLDGAASVYSLGLRSPDQQVNVWPMPMSMSNGDTTLQLSSDFQLMRVNNERSKYDDRSWILTDGFTSLKELLKMAHAVDSTIADDNLPGRLRGIEVVIYSSSDELQYGIDESYNLSIPNPAKSDFALIEAGTVYGALHALKTFSQLCHFNFLTRKIEVDDAPYTIIDQPRFSYRGLLIDTSRHYLPMPVIKNVIESMSYAKLNILHWHITDSQSFPLEIPSFPKLWDGAYSESERYTMADASEIVRYAQRRGINVLAEIDVPGHAGSWGVGYPSLWPSKFCKEPLDVSKDFTFQVINGVLSDLSKVFNFKFIHLGGDEVNTDCWERTPQVKLWLEQHKMNSSDAYRYFILKVQKMALSYGYEIVNWEEAFKITGDKFNHKAVVQNWLDTDVPKQAVTAGLRCIVSDQGSWYLDHLDTTWEEFYKKEPFTDITDPNQQKLILGGEVSMWGEQIDTSDIQQTIWPRAAAAAERLWTPFNKLAKDPSEVTARLAHFRCLLNQRGIAAAPLFGEGRTTPEEPGSFYEQ